MQTTGIMMQTTDLAQRRSPNPLDMFTRQVASTLITTYQQQLSPRKGFSCAYRVLHRSESCSQYTKRLILELGLSQALPLVRQRFQVCKAANQTLKAHGCRSASQREALPVLPTIATQNDQSIALAHQDWMAVEDAPLDDEPIDPPDENSEPGEEPRQRRTGGGSFRKPPVVDDSGTTEGTGSNSNDSNWSCDAINCASFGCDAIDCSSADWSAMHCGAADCNGLDCGSLDFGSCDVGSCDCSS